MAVKRYRVTFVDGREAVYEQRPIHLLRAERMTQPFMGMQEQVLLMIWAAATGGKGNRNAFEAWLEDVEDWERVKDEEAGGDAADPATPPQGSEVSPS